MLIDTFYELHPASYTYVRHFELKQTSPVDWEGYTLSLDVELSHQNIEETRKLLLSFKGIRNLKLTPPEAMAVQFVYLTITSIRDKGWDSLNYSVQEAENGTISFLCESFTATVAT